MSTETPGTMARRRALLTDSERELIATDDPAEPNRKYQAVSRVRNKIEDELTEDIEILAGNHTELHRELREVVCDDQADTADLRARLQDAFEDRDQAQVRADRLADELDQCETDLEDCRERLDTQDVDVPTLRRALEDIEAAAERGDGSGLQDALRRAREAVGDA